LYDNPLILFINFQSRLDEEQLPSFTQRLTPWQPCWTADRSIGCQTGLYNRIDNRLYTWYSRLYRVNGA